MMSLDPQQEDAAEVAGRVVLREVVAGQAARLEEHHRQGVAQGQGRRRARGRGELERAGLARHPVEEPVVGVAGEVRLRVAR